MKEQKFFKKSEVVEDIFLTLSVLGLFGFGIFKWSPWNKFTGPEALLTFGIMAIYLVVGGFLVWLFLGKYFSPKNKLLYLILNEEGLEIQGKGKIYGKKLEEFTLAATILKVCEMMFTTQPSV